MLNLQIVKTDGAKGSCCYLYMHKVLQRLTSVTKIDRWPLSDLDIHLCASLCFIAITMNVYVFFFKKIMLF